MDRQSQLLKIAHLDNIKETKEVIQSLKDEIIFLKSQLGDVPNNMGKIAEYGRLSEIIDLLSETVKEGTEEQVKKSIRTLMNGIYSY